MIDHEATAQDIIDGLILLATEAASLRLVRTLTALRMALEACEEESDETSADRQLH